MKMVGVVVIVVCLVGAIHCQEYVREPRLTSQDGNLNIFPGYNRNISLQLYGTRSCVTIGPYNVIKVLKEAVNASRTIKRVTKSLTDAQESLNSLGEIQITGPQGIAQRLTDLERNSRNLTRAYVTRTQFAFVRRNILQLRRRVNVLTTRINTIMNNVACASNPCKNGGTCLETVKGYFCLCPKNWEGIDCATDVNECTTLANTDLGCQNGAQCVNTPGSFECVCTTGWFGVHCTIKTNDCESSTDAEICGHGRCIPKAKGHQCQCEQGWARDDITQACTKDVNECEGKYYPCSVSPMVECINTVGSFGCASCPAGYSGNGYYCADINECAMNNGGCSTSPHVDCINNVGSFTCGPCPPGYSGNGVQCNYLGICQINNGGCHHFADCIETGGRQYCTCKTGFTGIGVGATGCVPTTNTHTGIFESCQPNPCVHGLCHQTLEGRRCICDVAFTGPLCDQPRDPCVPQPCMNGGTCVGDKATFGYRCECPSQYTGHNCEVKSSMCGGIRRMSDGRINYPNNNQTYTMNSQCFWIIETQHDKVLNVTITRFDLESSTECAYDFFEIYDGQNIDSNLIGRFCGNKIPKDGNIISSSNHLYLKFKSDQSRHGQGFELYWTSIDPLCGKEINATTHGIIKSPGAPGLYPNNRECLWVVHAPINKRIDFHFYTLQIENSTNCEHDYLSIYDGPTKYDKLLNKYCGTSHPQPQSTTGSSALVLFHSDESTNDYGFQISYELVNTEPGCGITYTQPKGEISPAKEGEYYMSNVLCEYKILLSPGSVIKLTFTQFHMENSPSCEYDYLEVFDGDTRSSESIGKYCGEIIPKPLYSTANKMLIVFSTDSSIKGEGFRILYEKVCLQMFDSPSGNITSPNYPNEYPDVKSTCNYIIKTIPGRVIRLSVLFMDIEDHSDCSFDYLAIYDGEKPLESTMMRKLCGSNPSQSTFTSTYNYLNLVFETDASVRGNGFLVSYDTIDVSCGGILKESEGIVQHPKPEKDSYDHDETCQWILSAPDGYIIEITKNTFDLEESGDCRLDYVEISENNTITGENKLIGTYCDNFPPTMTIPSNMVTIKFVSDQSVSAEGFSLSYSFTDASTMCGGTYHSPNGVITSPGWPNKYTVRKDCKWKIIAPSGRFILLNISSFELENLRGCSGDFLEIRNGEDDTSPLIGKFCGTTIPKTIQSMTNSITIHFQTDFSRNYQGFYMTWDSTSIGCGGTLQSYRGSIMSPNYPNPYNDETECMWRIITSAGSKLQLHFSHMDLERHRNCEYDYVEIFESQDSTDKIGKYCSTEGLPLQIITKSNQAFVRFTTDIHDTGSGFVLNYLTMCNANLTGLNGVIESINYPNEYPNDMDCTWRITAPKGNQISIKFNAFNLEVYEASIPTDFVEIYSTSDGESSKITYKGNDRPKPYLSKDNDVTIRFVSDMSQTFSGFSLEWTVVGCVGLFRRPEDSFTSPMYPNRYPHDTECHWSIEVSPDKSILLKIYDMDIDSDKDCEKDFFKIYNGPSDEYPLLANLCSKKKDIHYTSTGNMMYIKFHSDDIGSSKGFNASYESVHSVCGGKFKGYGGTITSPKYPQNYASGLECFYYLEVLEQHAVEITFNNIGLFSSYGRVNDSIKIYNGDSVTSPLIETLYEGDNVTFKSTKNKMLVVFHSTPESEGSRGFSADYKMLCGSVIVTNSSGIVSKDYEVYAKGQSKCIWTIISENLEDKVYLTFTHLSLGNDYTNCSREYIQIFSGESENSPSLGKYCGSLTSPTMHSHGNALSVVYAFDSNGSGDMTFTYSVFKTACGGNLTSESGEFTSPMYPNPYPSNSSCVWYIQIPSGNKITLQFNQFQLKPSDNNCEGDYVEIREESGTGKLRGIYCDEKPSFQIQSTKTLWIKFSSNAEVGSNGFKALYTYNMLNEINEEDIGQIFSPLYPRNYRGTNTYEYRITVSPEGSIVLTFKEFYIENYLRECVNYISIYDGFSEDSQLLGTYCGIDKPDPVRTTHNVVFIRFKMVTNTGIFDIEWKREAIDEKDAVNTNCGERISSTLGAGDIINLKSPGYPNGYNNSLRCEWIIQTDPIQHLILRIYDIMLEHGDGICHDKIKLYNGKRGTEEWEQVGGDICKLNSTSPMYISFGNTMKVVFETDQSVNKSGFSFNIYSDCGNKLENLESGILKLHRSDLIFLPIRSSDCVWDISVRNGRTIKIDFVSLIAMNNNCDNYLMLRNGGTEVSPLLGKGKYCCITEPEELSNLTTTSNKIHITFHEHFTHRFPLLNRSSFELRFSEVPMPCGDTIHLDDDFNSTEITSPHYPEIPDPYTECTWIFIGPSVHRLTVNFIKRFDIKQSENCEDEYVEIRDGSSERSHLLGKFCQNPLKTFTSTNNVLYLKFNTNIPTPSNGFKAKVSIDICGGTIYGSSGKIQSPTAMSLMFFKGVSIVCDWHIVAPENYLININIQQFDIRHSSSCEYSSLEILDKGKEDPGGNTTEYNLMNKTCNEDYDEWKPQPIKSISNEVIVRFSINKTILLSSTFNFVLNFNTTKSVCGGQMDEPSGFIELPSFTTRFMVCTWKITVPEGRRIKVEIVEDENNGNTPQQVPSTFWIAVYNGHLQNQLISMHLERQRNSSRYVYSSGNKAVVEYVNILSVKEASLFKVKYSSDEPTVCKSKFEYTEGVIHPPLYTGSRTYCEYPYKTVDDENFNGTLAIEAINATETCSSAPYQYVAAVYVPEFSRLGTICRLKVILSPYRNTVITTQYIGLGNNTYDVRYKLHPCGGIFNDNDITNNNIFILPQTYYGPLRCAWVVQIPSNTFLRIKTNQMIFGSQSCDSESLMIKDGPSRTTRLKTICYNNIPDQLEVHHPSVWFEYKADRFSNSTVFNISLSVEGLGIKTACGGIINTMFQNNPISTPDFPNKYLDNLDCEWTLKAWEGYRINLTFIDRFYIEKSQNCTKDYVEIIDWVGDKWISKGRYCSRDIPQLVYSTNHRMKVVFHSDKSGNADGFRAQWSNFCGGTYEITSEPQILKSPGVHTYSPNLNCTYILTEKDKNHINLEFVQFILETGQNNVCKYDNLTISSSVPFDEDEVLCGTNNPGHRRLMPPIKLHFMTDRYVSKKGFIIRAYTDNCGGFVNRSGEVISSSYGNSETYFRGMSCHWDVEAPKGKVVVLKFHYFVIEALSNCANDFVLLKNVVAPNDTARMCGNHTANLPVIKSKNNTMQIDFVTDDSLQYQGFKADIVFSYGEDQGCGGTHNVLPDSSHILPLHIWTNSTKYEPNLDCHWLFKAPDNHYVHISFTRFNVSKCSNETNNVCSCDYLEVRDGLSAQSTLMGRYCGDQLPENVTSTNNFIFVRFVSDEILESSGVDILVTSVESPCGPSNFHTKNEFQSLVPPALQGGQLPKNIKCEWNIKSNNSGIHLFFESLDVGVKPFQGNTCDADYIEVTSQMTDPLSDSDPTVMNIPFEDRNGYQMVGQMSYKGRFCGQIRQTEEYLYSTRAMIKLVTSNKEKTGKGFKIKFSDISCSRNYTNTFGKIVSQFIMMRHDEENCKMLISAPVNHTITIYMYSYMSSTTECDVYLQFLDGANDNSPELKKYCEDVNRAFVSSTGNSLTVKFHKEPRHFHRYAFSYTMTDKGAGCGGTILDGSGYLLSPNYPNAYRVDKVCDWSIRSPHSVIYIVFEVFEIAVTSSCQNYVELFDEDDVSLVKYCPQNIHTLVPDKFRVDGDFVRISYVTTTSNYKRGWILSYAPQARMADM